MDLRNIDTRIKNISRLVMADGLDCFATKFKRNRPIPVCEDVIGALKPKIKVLKRHLSNNAIARYDNDRILIPHRKFFKNSIKYYMTMFHELAHWMTPRMGRNHGGGDVKYATEEMTAQLTACYLIRLLELNDRGHVEEDTAGYLLYFKKGNLKTARRRAKAQARDIMKYCAHVYR